MKNVNVEYFMIGAVDKNFEIVSFEPKLERPKELKSVPVIKHAVLSWSDRSSYQVYKTLQKEEGTKVESKVT